MNKYDKIFDWYTIDEAFEICKGKVMMQIQRKLDHDEKKFVDNVIDPYLVRWDAVNRIATSFLGFKYSNVTPYELLDALRYFQKRNQLENDLNYVDQDKFKSDGHVSNAKRLINEFKSKKPFERITLKDTGTFPNTWDSKNVNPN